MQELLWIKFTPDFMNILLKLKIHHFHIKQYYFRTT